MTVNGATEQSAAARAHDGADRAIAVTGNLIAGQAAGDAADDQAGGAVAVAIARGIIGALLIAAIMMTPAVRLRGHGKASDDGGREGGGGDGFGKHGITFFLLVFETSGTLLTDE